MDIGKCLEKATALAQGLCKTSYAGRYSCSKHGPALAAPIEGSRALVLCGNASKSGFHGFKASLEYGLKSLPGSSCAVVSRVKNTSAGAIIEVGISIV